MQNFCNHPGWNAELCRTLCVRGEMGQMALAAEGLAGGPALGVGGLVRRCRGEDLDRLLQLLSSADGALKEVAGACRGRPGRPGRAAAADRAEAGATALGVSTTPV